jgi:hypothetical protein
LHLQLDVKLLIYQHQEPNTSSEITHPPTETIPQTVTHCKTQAIADKTDSCIKDPSTGMNINMHYLEWAIDFFPFNGQMVCFFCKATTVFNSAITPQMLH